MLDGLACRCIERRRVEHKRLKDLFFEMLHWPHHYPLLIMIRINERGARNLPKLLFYHAEELLSGKLAEILEDDTVLSSILLCAQIAEMLLEIVIE